MNMAPWAFVGLLGFLSITGCKPKEDSVPATSAPQNYFKTHFQDESQFIVESVLADLTEMAFYAKNKVVPNPSGVSIEAVERAGSGSGAPVYDVQISLKEIPSSLKFELPVTSMIWSPEVYAKAARSIFNHVGIEAGKHSGTSDDGRVLDDLMDGSALTIEELNQSVSKELEQDFLNPTAHEKAASILGAFSLREATGRFNDSRLPLCRMTAHLSFANASRGDSPLRVSGKMAEILLNTIAGNQRDALALLEKLGDGSPVVTAWTRAMRAYNTLDHRELAKLPNLSPLERRAWFTAFSVNGTSTKAWAALIDEEKKVTDFCRVANCMFYSVEIGHELLELSLPLERAEIESIYTLSRGVKVPPKDLFQELNQLPERCFTVGKDKKAVVRIIGWGQWAHFLQRELGHAVFNGHAFLQNSYSVPEYAKEFLETWTKQLEDLRIAPFVRRYTCSNQADYHSSVDEGFAVTVATPHLVSPENWNYLCFPPRFAPLYSPNPNPHVNEWHKHNPPPGTAYDLPPRMYHPSLVNQPDTVKRLETLHEIAPYDQTIIGWLIDKKYGTNATYEQLVELYQPVLEYSPDAMFSCACATRNEPDKYEPLMLRACVLAPWLYSDLADYYYDRNNFDQAALYAQKGIDLDPDRVRASNKLRWLMNYYLDKGERVRAKKLADFGGEIYSYRGLLAKAEFLEKTGQPRAALDWFKKIEERYSNWGDLVDFCLRYQATTQDDQFRPELEKRLTKIFPKGQLRVALTDFTSPPKRGVLIDEENGPIKETGLKKGDVIVALNGTQVQNLRQYNYIRDTGNARDLALIVWNGQKYLSIRANPPKHRFGVSFSDFNLK